MHNKAYSLLDMDYIYLCFDVDTNNLRSAVEGLRAIGIKGFNCTMPNKNLMCEFVDELSTAARMIGAVNTVINEDGKLIGHNTDGIGYMQSVKASGFDIIGRKMTILGSGGAATAICVQAALDGVAEIDIYSLRTDYWERTVDLIARINNTTSCKAALYDYSSRESLANSIAASAILVNATSVGMAPNEDECLITDTAVFRPDLIVSDIIYNPRETKLLRLAKISGCSTFNGLYMLLYQGAEAFRLWSGQDMPVEEIKRLYFSK